MDFMKASGLGVFPIGEAELTLPGFSSTERWLQSQEESKVDLMKKTIKVEMESIRRRGKSHRLWKCNDAQPEPLECECECCSCFAISRVSRELR